MFDNTALACPYYQHFQGGPWGVCVSGCWEEPSCITDEPRDGWRPRDERGRFVSREAFQSALSGSGS